MIGCVAKVEEIYRLPTDLSSDGFGEDMLQKY